MKTQICPFIAVQIDPETFELMTARGGEVLEEGYGFGTLEEIGRYIETRYGWHAHEIEILELV